jgi:hypothetical protein
MKQAARQKYEDDYGERVPDIVYDDVTFLDGMSNPDFDAEKYIQSKLVEPEKVEVPEVKAEKQEDIHALYFELNQKNVPNMKKNDTAWIKAKIAEKLAEKAKLNE